MYGMNMWGGTRGSAILPSASDVLGTSVVRGMKGVGGMCEMGMCLARKVWELMAVSA